MYGFSPSYSDKANALADISRQRAQRADQNGMWLQRELNNNIAKQWEHWGGLNGGHGGFGIAPQIGQDAHDWLGFYTREGVPNSSRAQDMFDWAQQMSGGVPRMSYSFLGHGAGGGMGMGDPTGGGVDGGMSGADARFMQSLLAKYGLIDNVGDVARFADPGRPSGLRRYGGNGLANSTRSTGVPLRPDAVPGSGGYFRGLPSHRQQGETFYGGGQVGEQYARPSQRFGEYRPGDYGADYTPVNGNAQAMANRMQAYRRQIDAQRYDTRGGFAMPRDFMAL